MKLEEAQGTLEALRNGIEVEIPEPLQERSGTFEIYEETADMLSKCCNGPVEGATREDIKSAALVLFKYEDGEQAMQFAIAVDGIRAMEFAESLGGSIKTELTD